MLNIMEVNNSITRVINDSSEENLKEAISHLRRALCKHRYLGAFDLTSLCLIRLDIRSKIED